jgi:hypothetical protein
MFVVLTETELTKIKYLQTPISTKWIYIHYERTWELTSLQLGDSPGWDFILASWEPTGSAWYFA